MKIRNFCIIAHIDHGKSTLADRMLELTGTVSSAGKQMLDTMDLEKERGITIKLTPARMQRKWYELNLIDTPGHVDFQYEVSRSLAAVEGVVLLVDASQGIQAQTLSTLYMALDQGIEIIPVLNKIDLPAADPERVAKELEHLLGVDKNDIIAVSAKTGANVDNVLDAIIERIDDPHTFQEKHVNKFWAHQVDHDKNEPSAGVARALIFDSVFDQYKWVVAYIKVMEGTLRAGDQVHFIYSEKTIAPTEVGYFSPSYTKDKQLTAGQIWYLVTWQKSVRDAKIGDTIVGFGKTSGQTIKSYDIFHKYVLPGFKKSKPYVYAWVYPIDTSDYEKLKESFEKLSLNDSAIAYEYEQSQAMGHGFRCGFLGTLHMDIIRERLLREYNMDTIFTTPTVTYLIKSKYLKDERILAETNIKDVISGGYIKYIIPDADIDGLADEEIFSKYGAELKPWLVVKSGGDMPEQWNIEEIREPLVEVEIVWPEEFSGNIMWLAQEYRWRMLGMEYLDKQRVLRRYILPMGEIIIDFYDSLKSATKWYATMNYEFKTFEASDLVRLDIYINGEKVEAFSLVVHESKAYHAGKELVEKLKTLIPKHLFAIPLQAGVGNKMIARETISAIKKDVLAKCYGWDVSRKRKLLQKQKEWKKKMKAMWSVNVPSDIFIKMVAK